MKSLVALFHLFFITNLSFAQSDTISQRFIRSQQVIKLDDITEFKLITHQGGLSRVKRILEVVQANGQWKCYQIHFTGYDLKAQKMVDDSVRTFVKDIPSKTLQQLLDIITRKDTGVNKNLFKVDKAKLTDFVDSLKAELKPEQKREFIDSLDSERIINESLNTVVHPFPMDDATYFGITITTRQKVSVTIYAESFAALYNLPWHIDNIKSFDPNIGLIFASISGYDRFERLELDELHRRIVRVIYYKYFQTQFNWDSFKSDQPSLFAKLGGTFTPVIFYKEQGRSILSCRSSLLPQYVQIRFGFTPGDTSSIGEAKRFENKLSKIFKSNNFLFDYLQQHPGYIVELSPGNMEERGEYLFRDIKKYFNGIDRFDYRKSLVLEVGRNRAIDSQWVWLPDNSLVLIGLRLNDKDGFVNQKVQLSDGNSYPHNRMVCVLINSSGQVIQNYGFADRLTP